MAVILKVGESNQMRPVPKHFPTCGNYIPVEGEEEEKETSSTTEFFNNTKAQHESSSSSRNRVVQNVQLAIIFILVSFLVY